MPVKSTMEAMDVDNHAGADEKAKQAKHMEELLRPVSTIEVLTCAWTILPLMHLIGIEIILHSNITPTPTPI